VRCRGIELCKVNIGDLGSSILVNRRFRFGYPARFRLTEEFGRI